MKLTGEIVTLEPMASGHIDPLYALADDKLWTWFPNQLNTREAMAAYVHGALAEQEKGTQEPFVVRVNATGELAGSTRFMNIDRANRRYEIGSTWYGLRHQRTGINTECKWLLISHAFENLDAIRVELKTDSLNTPSRNAIRRIGAAEEGTLRSHMIMPSGRLRDTVYYGITRADWPAVKEHLQRLLLRT